LNTFFARLTDRLRPGNAAGDDGTDGGGFRLPESNVSIPLYVAGAAVQISGLAAVAYQLSDPRFSYFTMILTVVGMAVSYYLRRLGTPSRLLKAGALFLGLVFLFALRGAGIFGDLVPLEVRGSQEMLLVCALAFTATFFSFLLVTDEAVAFTCVWSIAMIGLTGTVNINRELIMCFVAFLGAASFLLVHQNSLANGMAAVTAPGDGDDAVAAPLPRAGVRSVVGRRGAAWGLLRTQALVALACGAAAIVLGLVVAIPLQMVGRNLSLATIIQRLNVPAAAATKLGGGAPRLSFDNLGQFQVGLGPVSDDPTERMTVTSDRPFYWRGRVFDFYNGHGWSNTYASNAVREVLAPTGERTGEQFNVFNLPDPPFARKKTERLTHRFHVNSASFAPLYHAAEPHVVRIPTDRLVRRPDNSMGAQNGYGYEYEVISDVPDVRPADLRATGQDYPLDVSRLYLYQGTENEKLQDLTNEIITQASATNPYDKVEALRQWVSQRCTYTLDARAVPNKSDAVDFFLNESKEGYCDLYATALTMLCRYAGVPARLVTGFAPGTLMDGSGPRKYLLRGSDLHAWTEVYFAGYGWIPFDATQDAPGTYVAPRTPEPVQDEPSILDKLLKAGWLPLLLTGAGAAGLIYFVLAETHARVAGPRVGRGDGPGLAAEVLRTYNAAVRRLARGRAGVRRLPTMTGGEYLDAVRARYGTGVADAFAPLTGLMQRALYGPAQVSAADVRAAHRALAEVNTALKTAPPPPAQNPTTGEPPVAPAAA
jgi:transglutaminase-like putative cysteine protease